MPDTIRLPTDADRLKSMLTANNKHVIIIVVRTGIIRLTGNAGKLMQIAQLPDILMTIRDAELLSFMLIRERLSRKRFVIIQNAANRRKLTMAVFARLIIQAVQTPERRKVRQNRFSLRQTIVR